jgi:hypothetical protein
MEDKRMEPNNVDEINSASFVCAAKMYSRAKNDSVWVLFKYPFQPEVESEYIKTKAQLGLNRRPKSKWKIWPYPFKSPDGKACYFAGTSR